MKLSDLIIEHGPYRDGDIRPANLTQLPAAAVNELRDELIAAQRARELADETLVVLAMLIDPNPCSQFDHHGDRQTHGTGATRPCPQARAKALLTELVQRAGEHAEACG